ncbi:hypothetical protein J7M23_04490 [Candidatus Sumerlaeota bacterium]|nr:hypothetical protein [Candidatus Sumerlaeota bacterium]
MRRIPIPLILFLLFILLIEGSYCLYRIQKEGYGVNRIILPKGMIGTPNGLLIFVYTDTECKHLKKIIYHAKGLPLKIPADGVPGVTIKHWRFSCRLVGRLKVKKSAIYEFHFKFKDGARLFIDGKKVADFWTDKSWNTRLLKEIPLKSGWHSIELALRIISYGGYAELSWREKGQKKFALLTAKDLIPAIP